MPTDSLPPRNAAPGDRPLGTRGLPEWSALPAAPLSSAGGQRRVAILARLERALAARRRRRAVLHCAAAVALAGSLAAAALGLREAIRQTRLEPPAAPSALSELAGAEEATPRAPRDDLRHVEFSRLPARQVDLARYVAAARTAPKDIRVDDDGARALLAQSGRPAGRVCIAGRCRLEIEIELALR